LDLFSHLKLKTQAKFMKPHLSDLKQQKRSTRCSLRRETRNVNPGMIEVYSLGVLIQGKGTQTKSGSLLILKRHRLKFRKKESRICSSESTTKGTLKRSSPQFLQGVP
jgi:hypothetical protein